MALNAYFSRQRRISQFNLGNTVLVSGINNDDFYLGFLQDIKGDRFFIDFDSSQQPAQWVPINRIWHHARSSILMISDPRDVYVAVRQEDGGPYTFRPAKLLRSFSHESQWLCCVSVGSHCGTSSTGNEQSDLQVVHAWQLIHRLPSNRRVERICQLPFKKVVFRSSRVNSALSGIQEQNIVDMLHLEFRDGYIPLVEVCALWNAILGDPASAPYVTMDWAAFSSQQPQRSETEGYRLGMLLHRVVSKSTKTLALINMQHRADTLSQAVSVVVELLRLKPIIPIIIVKNPRAGIERVPIAGIINWSRPELAKIRFQLLPLKAVCQRLLVSNFTVCFSHILLPKFYPEMPKYCSQKPRNLKLFIKIPIMRFRKDEWDDGWTQQYKAELNRHCPPVTSAIVDKLRRRHMRWLGSVPYPGKKWAALRMFLEFYGECPTADIVTYWRDLDLRNFENISRCNLAPMMLAYHYISSFDS
ncbi:uncharacterized protein LOC129586480 [Paramacrobiotus metropolitanus]|uniref:uncharacterized protein LOC129586480 n=1 Tax=Paramacrobiotus metropolitanus TaxID=2943436 RepID=UPI002445C2E0|nr:uncharacterized protein LOC129586480 [Paramacrobiotus metropolitanus]